MIQLPTGTRIWIAAGMTGMRRGFDGLSGQVQTVLQKLPFMMHRLRLALKNDSKEKLGGEGGTVEADACFIGGSPKNRHSKDRKDADGVVSDACKGVLEVELRPSPGFWL